MKDHMRKLVTVVTEAALESSLSKDVARLGARGFTVTEARGSGSRGVRMSEWSQSKNIRFEVICDAATADAIAAHLAEKYYADYAMIVFVSDVVVLRPHKF